ncbi:MAG: MFS transporter [Bacteroidota bacterium]
MRTVAANVPKLYLIKFFKWFLLYMPVIVLFYMDNGLSIVQVMTIQAVYSICMALFELPSGYFSDVLGRRLTLILGMGLNFVGIMLLSFSYGFWAFAGSAVIVGLGASFISGTDSAMLYDSLLQMGKEKKYLKLEGRTYSIGTFAEAIAAIFGGWIAASLGYRFAVECQVFIAFLGVIVALTLVEPKVYISSEAKESSGFERIKAILEFTFRKGSLLKWYIIISAFTGSATLMMAWFAQPFFKAIDLSDGVIGILWSALNLTVAFFSFYAYKIMAVTKRNKILAGLTLGIALGFLALSFFQSLYGLVFVFIIYVLRGIAVPVMKDFINIHTPSEMRATVLSIRGFIIRMTFAGLAPLFGWVTDVYSLSQAFLVAAISFMVLNGIALLFIFTFPNPEKNEKTLVA